MDGQRRSSRRKRAYQNESENDPIANNENVSESGSKSATDKKPRLAKSNGSRSKDKSSQFTSEAATLSESHEKKTVRQQKGSMTGSCNRMKIQTSGSSKDLSISGSSSNDPIMSAKDDNIPNLSSSKKRSLLSPSNSSQTPYSLADKGSDIFNLIMKSIHKKSASRCTGLSSLHWYRPPTSIVQSINAKTIGLNLKQVSPAPVENMLSDFYHYSSKSPFNRRCTVVEWHPQHPHILAVGSKGGDIYILNTKEMKHIEPMTVGIGPGGSVQALKFDPDNQQRCITASIDGTVKLQSFNDKYRKVILDTLNCHDFWYCSLDVNAKQKLLVAGDNVGKVSLVSTHAAYEKMWELKLHKSKVTHAEFSPREPWLLATASTDSTVQLWDVRMIKNKKSSLCVLKHNKGVNSAYFNLTDGTQLLTTDQNQAINIYQSPDFSLRQSIAHPHRQFRHLTPIKAHWHPLQDLVVVGRYPDEKFPGHTPGEKRTIDIFNADSGRLVTQLFDPATPGCIVSLNKFNYDGSLLASTMGLHLILWSMKQQALERRDRALITLTPGELNSESQPTRRRANASIHRKTRTLNVKTCHK